MFLARFPGLGAWRPAPAGEGTPPLPIEKSCIAWRHLHPLFSMIFRFVFGLVFCRSLEGPWAYFGTHFDIIFGSKIRPIFGLIFQWFFH